MIVTYKLSMKPAHPIEWFRCGTPALNRALARAPGEVFGFPQVLVRELAREAVDDCGVSHVSHRRACWRTSAVVRCSPSSGPSPTTTSAIAGRWHRTATVY